MKEPYTYPKAEKLCSKKIFEELIIKNKPFGISPFKVYWLLKTLPESVPAQSAVTVPKRRFKHAVSRNLLKRRMREAFRLNKHKLYEELENQNKQMALLIIYNNDKLLKYNDIYKSMLKVIGELITIIGIRSEEPIAESEK